MSIIKEEYRDLPLRGDKLCDVVVLANSGEFGGSTAQVPLPKHERLIAHVHGNQQVAVSVFEVDPSIFKSTEAAKVPKALKAPPAGYKGRPR